MPKRHLDLIHVRTVSLGQENNPSSTQETDSSDSEIFCIQTDRVIKTEHGEERYSGSDRKREIEALQCDKGTLYVSRSVDLLNIANMNSRIEMDLFINFLHNLAGYNKIK